MLGRPGEVRGLFSESRQVLLLQSPLISNPFEGAMKRFLNHFINRDRPIHSTPPPPQNYAKCVAEVGHYCAPFNYYKIYIMHKNRMNCYICRHCVYLFGTYCTFTVVKSFLTRRFAAKTGQQNIISIK